MDFENDSDQELVIDEGANKKSDLNEIPSKIVSNINISSSVTNSTEKDNFLIAATSKIIVNSQDMNQTSISMPGTTKTATASNLESKSIVKSTDSKFSKRKSKKYEKEGFIKKGKQKFQHVKLVESIIKSKECKNVKNEADLPFSLGIEEILDNIRGVQMNSEHLKSYVISLSSFLSNPQNAPDVSILIFLVIHYLHMRVPIPLQKFLSNPEAYPFLLSSEICIASSLIEIEKMAKPHLQGFMKSLLSVMYHLVLEKRKLNVCGMSSVCRVFTELCKLKGDKIKPLNLCCDLLKRNHFNSPVLIASIIGVWKELFEIPDNFAEEQIIWLSSITYGACKRMHKTKKITWKCSYKLIEEYIAVPSLPDAKETVEWLKDQIVSKCLQGSFENLWYLTSSLVILASREPWEWTKNYLLNDYIATNLKRFSKQDLNEKAFDLFCNLYVDVYFLAPTKFADTVLIKFVEQKVFSKDKEFIPDCAAAALMKYVRIAKRNIPTSLIIFIHNHPNNAKVKLLEERLAKTNVLTCPVMLSIKDVMIHM